jgi:hypothetical protein
MIKSWAPAAILLGMLPGFSQTRDGGSASMAKVYVYRYKAFEGKALRPSIYVNDADIARLQSGRGVVLSLAAGKHTFRSNDKQSQIEIDVKADQTYYIRIDIARGFFKGHGRLTMVAPEQGDSEFKQVKPVDRGMIKSKELIASDFVPSS